MSHVAETYRPGSFDEAVSVLLSLDGEEGGRWTLHFDTDGCKVTEGKFGQTDCVIRTSPEILERFLKGGTRPTPREVRSRLFQTDNLSVARQVRHAFDF